MRVALVTWSGLPDLSVDDHLLRDELLRDGHEVVAAVWDDSSTDWQRFDAIVLRSTWDYHKRADEFRAWLAGLGDAPLWNPRALVERNIHKRYLLDLPNAVPTMLLPAGTKVVVKPAVSATAFETHVLELPVATEVLLQPFVPEVLTHGEWSFVFFANEFSHAVLKRPRDGDFRVQSDFGGSVVDATPSPALLADAKAVAASIPRPWLYARIDGVERDGRLLLMELELTEPALFLGRDPHAARRFADAIRALHEQHRDAEEEDQRRDDALERAL